MSKLSFHVKHFPKQSINMLYKHNFRKNKHYKNPDVDLSRSENNDILKAPKKTLYKDAKERVEATEGRVNSRSNWMTEIIGWVPAELKDPADQIAYCADVLAYMEDRFGESNILSFVIHRDEYKGAEGSENAYDRVHFHADMTPITRDNKLASSKLFTKSSMEEMHRDLAEFLIERGYPIERSEKKKQKQTTLTLEEYKASKEAEKEQLRSDLAEVRADLEELKADRRELIEGNTEMAEDIIDGLYWEDRELSR